MRRLLAAVLVVAAGCSSYDPPTSGDFERIRLAPAPPPKVTRTRVHVSLDSRWLAGEFDGVVLAQPGAARIQLFGDLGPKMIDLLARPDRVLGFFPQTREGVNVALPKEAVPHPLLFLGVNILEDMAAVDESRVLGVRETGDGWWLDLKPLVPGMRVEAFRTREGVITERRFRWMFGVHWDEERVEPDELSISAPGVDITVRLLSTETLTQAPAKAFELTVPDDVRVVGSARK